MASLAKHAKSGTSALDQINDLHAGMLGIVGSDMHMQPMAPYADPTTNTIWFYTKTTPNSCEP